MENIQEENSSAKTKMFTCNSCKETFASKLLIDKHCKSGVCSFHENNDIQQFSNDERHSFSKTSDEALCSPPGATESGPFVCGACGKCFPGYEQLTSHDCAHTNDQIFSCDTCGKSFSSRVKLYTHVRVHLSKQFKCEVCDKSFTNRAHLTIHLRIHSKAKPYSCDLCKKSFSQRSTLVRHMVVHTDKKTFTCRSCFKNFSDRHTYVLHLQAHLVLK